MLLTNSDSALTVALSQLVGIVRVLWKLEVKAQRSKNAARFIREI